jgi:hypothetical protein
MGHKVRESPTEHGQIEPDRTLLRVKSVPEWGDFTIDVFLALLLTWVLWVPNPDENDKAIFPNKETASQENGAAPEWR